MSVNVGVFDSKIDFSHKDLVGAEQNTSDEGNPDGHGTHVAGIIAALMDNYTLEQKDSITGVAPNANLFGYSKAEHVISVE